MLSLRVQFDFDEYFETLEWLYGMETGTKWKQKNRMHNGRKKNEKKKCGFIVVVVSSSWEICVKNVYL